MDLNSAERIIADYGHILASSEPTGYGMPVSLLPHNKDTIKDAIQLVLTSLGKDEPQIHESLIQGYVYLAQFIPDEDARIIDKSYRLLRQEHLNPQEMEDAQLAARIINGIKAEMENLMSDLALILN